MGKVQVLIASERIGEDWSKPYSVSVNLGKELISLDYGRVYYVNDGRLEKVKKALDDLVDSRSNILCVSRLHPDIINQMWNGGVAEAVWLSERIGQNNVSPEQLSRLRQRITSFLSSKKDPIVVLDGLEYISLFNDISKLQIFVEQLNDAIMEWRAILLIPIDPRLFDQRTLARLQRFAEVVL